MDPAPTTEEKALKIRSLLQSYYVEVDQETDQRASGMSVRTDSNEPSSAWPTPTASSAPSSTGGDGHASDAPINAIYFDPEAHLRRMIKETRLGSLVDQHRSIAAEVGSLDSDMQTLVYENYNKFIAATDIIRSLDGSMSDLDGRLRHLESLISAVVDRSEAVNGTLELRQAAILELNTSRLLFQKLQVLLDVPRKLRVALEAEAYDVVAETYAQAAPVLERHGHRHSLHKVMAEVESYRACAAGRLRQRLLKHPEAASETISLIAQLGEPTESLQDDFLGCQRQRIVSILNASQTRFSLKASVNSGASVEEDLCKVVEDLDIAFLSELERTAQLFSELFDAVWRPRLIAEAREWFLRYICVVRSALESAAACRVARAACLHVDGTRIVSLISNEKGRHYCDDDDASESNSLSLSSGCAGAGSRGTNDNDNNGINLLFSKHWGVADLSSVLGTVRADLPSLETSFPELAPRDKVLELAGNVVRQHVTLAFAAVEARLAVEIGEISSRSKTTPRRSPSLAADFAREEDKTRGGDSGDCARGELYRDVELLHSVATNGLERVFAGLREWMEIENSWVLEGWADVFTTLVQSQLATWLQSVPLRCLATVGLAPTPPAPTVSISGMEGGSATVPFVLAWGQCGNSPQMDKMDKIRVFEHEGDSCIAGATATPTLPSPPNSHLLLTLSVFCSLLGTRLASRAAQLLSASAASLSLVDDDDTSGRSFYDGKVACDETATSLLKAYETEICNGAAHMMKTATNATVWGQHPEPKAPSMMCIELLSRLGEVDADLLAAEHAAAAAAGSGPQTSAPALAPGGGSSIPHHSRQSTGGGSIESVSGTAIIAGAGGSAPSTGRPVLGPLPIVAWHSRGDVACHVAFAALQAQAAALRSHTLSRSGFQQLQLDCHFLRPEIQRTVVGARSGHSALAALDEVLVVGAERCGEPVMLESTTLDRIIHVSQQQQMQRHST